MCIAEPCGSNFLLEHRMCARSRLCKAVLEGATCLATGEEGFTVTHRGNITPAKCNMKTFILVQFDR